MVDLSVPSLLAATIVALSGAVWTVYRISRDRGELRTLEHLNGIASQLPEGSAALASIDKSRDLIAARFLRRHDRTPGDIVLTTLLRTCLLLSIASIVLSTVHFALADAHVDANFVFVVDTLIATAVGCEALTILGLVALGVLTLRARIKRARSSRK